VSIALNPLAFRGNYAVSDIATDAKTLAAQPRPTTGFIACL
jgi:hypothetical protein